MAGPDLTANAEAADIQGLLRTGYGGLQQACFLLLTMRDATAARRWLAAHVDRVTTAERWPVHVTQALHIAVTAQGLVALGMAEPVVRQFAPEFVAGMSGDPARSRRLGDVGPNDPARWEWGGSHRLHLLVLLYAEAGLDAFSRSIETADFAVGFAPPLRLRATDLGGREPFGFTDGISQPLLDWHERRVPGTRDDVDYGNCLSAGEFILGYPNEYGLITDRPLLDPAVPGAAGLPAAMDDATRRDLGRNGSYLVLRELYQDVRGFWRFLADQAGDQAEALAEKFVGRRMDGAPLVPIQDDRVGGIAAAENRFIYDQDRDGQQCPIGAHIRRANPRTGDMPPGTHGLLARLARMLGLGKEDLREDLIASARFHRLLRRGRPFGRLLSPQEARDPGTEDPEAGLYFIGLNANIARQFEFIQNAWMMSAKFAGLSGEADPLLGNREDFPPGQGTSGFGIPQANGVCRYVAGLPPFVTVRGGEYFFLPGIRALRFIAGSHGTG